MMGLREDHPPRNGSSERFTGIYRTTQFDNAVQDTESWAPWLLHLFRRSEDKDASGLGAFCLLGLPLAGTPLGVSVADDSVMVIARLYATAGREAELEARLLKSVEFVRKAEPDITYRAYRSKKDPSMFVYYEVYPSQTAFDRHAKETMPAFRRARTAS